MFFVLSKTVGLLAQPLCVVILFLLLFFLLHRRRPSVAWPLFWIAVLSLWALSSQPVTDLLLRPLEQPYEDGGSVAGAEVIVVLGGSLDLRRSTPERLELGSTGDRVVEGLLLARELPRAKLIFSGGTASLRPSPKREASLLKGLAVRMGIHEDRVLVEDRSRNTRENAVQTRRLLDNLGARQVVLVTSAHHMRRALACFRKVGVDAVPHAVDFRNHYGQWEHSSLVPSADNLDASTKAIKEYLGLMVYRMRGYL